jgi:methylmalonyl-CoA mutase cobalamin-binding subunit
LLQRYITYHDQYDAIREFTQALRDRHWERICQVGGILPQFCKHNSLK